MDINSRFKRAIVIVGAFASAVSASQRILGIDRSHSKSQHFSGVQMHLVGRDGNMKNITLAFALVPSEDAESYEWFFQQLVNSGFSFTGTPIFCDRGAALLSIAPRFGLTLRFCTLHIIRNIAHHFGQLSQQGLDVLYRDLVWSVSDAARRTTRLRSITVMHMVISDRVI